MKKLFFQLRIVVLVFLLQCIKKIFEPYYQITNEKKSIQGMGLGLPIVRKIIEDLNAAIKIEKYSRTQRGITISVILTQYKKSATEIVLNNMPGKKILFNFEEKKEYADVVEPGRQSILLVEDNVSMVNYLIKKLGERYNVYAVSNGNEALQKIKGSAMVPDLIVSDVMMDKVDGYEFIKIISKYPSYNHIPVIFLSAKATHEDKLLGLGLGAIDFIQKPFKISELLQKVESVLINSDRQRQAVLAGAFKKINNQHNLKLNHSGDLFKQNCDAYKLTSRERNIVKLICEGCKYKAIGEALFISERTVTKHVQNIFEKLQVSNKIELINKLEAA